MVAAGMTPADVHRRGDADIGGDHAPRSARDHRRRARAPTSSSSTPTRSTTSMNTRRISRRCTCAAMHQVGPGAATHDAACDAADEGVALTSRRFRSHFEACGIRDDAQNFCGCSRAGCWPLWPGICTPIRSSLKPAQDRPPEARDPTTQTSARSLLRHLSQRDAEDRRAVARADGPGAGRPRSGDVGEGRAQAAHARDAAARPAASRPGDVRAARLDARSRRSMPRPLPIRVRAASSSTA